MPGSDLLALLPAVCRKKLPKYDTQARTTLNLKVAELCRRMWDIAMAEVPAVPDHEWSSRGDLEDGLRCRGGDVVQAVDFGFGPHLSLSHAGFLRQAGDPKADAFKLPNQVHAEMRMFPHGLTKADPTPGYEYKAVLFIREGVQLWGQSRDLVRCEERHFHGTDADAVARAVGAMAAKILARRSVALPAEAVAA